MIGAGAELAAVGQVLREAARVAAPAVSRVRGGRDRRTDAYNDLQRAAVELLARLDTLVTMQDAVPANGRAVLGSAVVAGARAFGDTAQGLSRLVGNATQTLSLALLAREMVERFDADRAVRLEMVKFNGSVSHVLGGLTEVRLVGGHDAQEAAERLVAIIGEAISELPIVRDGWLNRTRSATRYDELRTVAMYHLRIFGAVARQDLSTLPWRRRVRRSRWRFYRPKPPEIRTVALDTEQLINAAAQAI